MNRVFLIVGLAAAALTAAILSFSAGVPESKLPWALGLGALAFVTIFWNWHWAVRVFVLVLLIGASSYFERTTGSCLCTAFLVVLVGSALRSVTRWITQPTTAGDAPLDDTQG